MNASQLSRELRRIARREVPNGQPNLWPAIQRQLAQSRPGVIVAGRDSLVDQTSTPTSRRSTSGTRTNDAAVSAWAERSRPESLCWRWWRCWPSC